MEGLEKKLDDEKRRQDDVPPRVKNDGRQSSKIVGGKSLWPSRESQNLNGSHGSVSLATSSDQHISDFASLATTTDTFSVEDTIDQWLAQGRDLNLPLEYYEPVEHLVNTISPPKVSKPTGLRAFFSKLSKQLMPTAIIDSGATGHFIKPGEGIPTGRRSSKVVGMPNGQTERASRQVLLPMQQLTQEARLGDELPSLHSNLVSVPKLANNGYTTLFKPWQEGVEVYHSSDIEVKTRGEPVLRGCRDRSGLWRLPMTNEVPAIDLANCCVDVVLPQAQINNLYHLPSVESRVAYIHACLGYPTKAAMLNAAAKGFLTGIPFANVTNIRRFYPETSATPKGHMDQVRQGVRSTKTNTQEQVVDSREKEHDVHIQVWDLKQTTYSDQTGRFPFTSYKGNKYIMTMVEIDSSAILVEALKDRSKEELTRAYLVLLQRLKKAGIIPKKHVMDNEISELMRDTIEKECKLELVPPGCHRRNVAEVAIKTFKAHFIAILAGLPSSFPIRLWCELLPQAELTLNILRPSHARPQVSAHTYLYGQFDFDRTPLAPIGSEMQCHEKPNNRGTWAEHSVDGWFLASSLDHYRGFICYIKATRARRVCDTVQFMHKHITQPALTAGDAITKAANALKQAIKGKQDWLGDQQAHDLQYLSDLTKAVAASYSQKQSSATHSKPPTTSNTAVSSPRVPKSEVSSPRVATPSQRVEQEQVVEFPSGPEQVVEYPSEQIVESPPELIVESKPQKRSFAQEKRRGLLKELKHLEPSNSQVDEAPPASRTRSRTRQSSSASNIARALCAAAVVTGGTLAPQVVAARQYPMQVIAEMANAVLDKETGDMLEYRQLLKNPKYRPDWSLSSANEFGRLCNGIGGRIKNPTNTMFFVNKTDVPQERFKDVTYGKFVCVVRPQKAEPNRTRLTLGGNLVNYPGEVGTPTADMLLIKIMLNSVVSTPRAKFMGIDISNFYLNTPLPR